MRPVLRPGLRVLRRDPRLVQVGLDWPGVVAVADTPELRHLLHRMDGSRTAAGIVAMADADGVDRATTNHLLATMVRLGIVVDQPATVAGSQGQSASAWANAWLVAPPHVTAGELVGRQRAARYWVHGGGAVADAVRAALPGRQLTLHPSAATVSILAADHEPDRLVVDERLRSGQPHLVAHVRDTVGVVGPFVDPGASACLRCVDAARADLDPAWPILVASATDPPPTAPSCEEALARLVGAYAAREAVQWATGLPVASVGATIDIPLGPEGPERTRFEPHPCCGCWWQGHADERTQAIMGA